MKCYIIVYDLNNWSTQDYSELHNAIKSYRTWAHISESVWAIVTEQKATTIRDYLKTKMDANDLIFIIKSWTEAAWWNVMCRDQWLKDNL